MASDDATASRYRALLADGLIEVHYQPIVSVRHGAVVAIEALARLRDGDRLILPEIFLSRLAGEDREALFRAVLHQGIECLRRLAPAAPALRLSVNVDAEVLSRGAVPATIGAALAAGAIAPDRLIVELLESHAFPDLDRARHGIESLRRVGVSVALDDLGVEFSTLKRVQRLQVDYLKIDRTFLADAVRNPNDLVFLTAFVLMAKVLRMELCVEGVETVDMLDAVRIMGVPMVQGFGIARPMPPAVLFAWFAAGAGQPVKGPPRTLLGAFVLHLRWLGVFLYAPSEMSLRQYLKRDSKMSLTDFLRRAGLDREPLGIAHAELMAWVEREDPSVAEIAAAADRVRTLLAEAVIAQSTARNIPGEGLSRSDAPARSEPARQPRERIADRPVGQG